MVNLANGHFSQGEFMVNDCKNYPNCGGFHPNFKTKHYEPVGFCLLNAPDWRWIFLQIGHASPATRGDFGILLKASQGFIGVGLSNFWILQSCPPKFSKRQSKPAPELNGLISSGYLMLFNYTNCPPKPKNKLYTLWWFNIAIENGHWNSEFSH